MPDNEPPIPPVAFTALFSPLDDASRQQAVARRIARAIELGHLPAGARLPSESELASMLSVSTITLREALGALRHQGLVETRRGRGGGTFVREARTHAMPSLGALLSEFASDDLRELGDHSAAIRGAAAKGAAERASDAEVAALLERLQRLEGATEPADWRREEGRLNVELASAAHSTRLTREELGLQEEAADLLLSGYESREGALDRYRRLLHFVEARDGDGARAVAEEHVNATVARLIELLVEVTQR